MAYLRFKPDTLHIDVLVGVLEEYKPTKEVKTLFNRIERLKERTDKFLKKNWKDLSTEDIGALFKEDKEQKKIWDEYFQNKYLPEIQKLKTKVETINKKLTPKV